ncbi:MAG: ATP-grasp domain-containing protein, partial [Planctomycetes bacterium]|nr:ATP-grasp domain-containing protein [Planctomycetota bacterium]
MRVAILHGAITEPNRPDEQDTFVQVKVISEALRELGHEVLTVPFSLNLQEAARALRAASPDAVFNLVESVEGAGRLIHLAPSLLDLLGFPYTGSGTEALVLTSNKLLAKRALRARAMTTPRWYSVEDLARDGRVIHAPYIIKPVWEHASVGLDEDSVLTAGRREALREACLRRSNTLAGPCYAEAFIDGREFNVPILAGDAGPQVLPPSEIIFVGYDERQKPKVVGYRAKWEEGSYEYDHTPRRFDFPPDDQALIESMAELAKHCWHIFELRGYARVDFRVDKAGTAYVLEINANPCLSPDGGFAAAVRQAGMTFRDAIAGILRDLNMPPLPRGEGGGEGALPPLPRGEGRGEGALPPLPRGEGGGEGALPPLPRGEGGGEGTLPPLPRGEGGGEGALPPLPRGEGGGEGAL